MQLHNPRNPLSRIDPSPMPQEIHTLTEAEELVQKLLQYAAKSMQEAESEEMKIGKPDPFLQFMQQNSMSVAEHHARLAAWNAKN
jgi:hypothetical protein